VIGVTSGQCSWCVVNGILLEKVEQEVRNIVLALKEHRKYVVTVSLIQQSHCLKIDLSEIRMIPSFQIQANDGVAFCLFRG